MKMMLIIIMKVEEEDKKVIVLKIGVVIIGVVEGIIEVGEKVSKD